MLGEVKAGEPAALAGLRSGDRVLSIDGLPIVDAQTVVERVRGSLRDGQPVGYLTSGGYGYTVGKGIGMGYVSVPHHKVGTALQIEVRGKGLQAQVAKLPFVKQG